MQIDRILAGNLQQQSYYFQLIPISLTLVNKQCELPSPDTTYRFSILKGTQKFDQNKIPITAEFTRTQGGLQALHITSCRLNFYIPSLTRGRKTQFTLKLIQHEHNQDYELGDYIIDANKLVEEYKKKDNSVTRHEIKHNFSDDYELDFEIYVDTNRVALEKNIRDKKGDRAIKSPLRQRKEEETQLPGRKNLTGDRGTEEKPSGRGDEGSTVRNRSTAKKERESQQQTPAPEEEKVISNQQQQGHFKFTESRQSRPAYDNNTKKGETASIASKNSKSNVPLVSTTFKPLSKLDAPSQIKMTDSQRMAQNGQTTIETVLHGQQQSTQEKALLWAFLLVSSILIYWAMNPSRRV